MNKTDLLLQMMEQPQRYTSDEWQEILADDACRELYTLMSKTQSAVDAVRANEDITDDMIDAEWQRLAQPHSQFAILHSQFRKVAALFIGVLMLSGIAYAAIHIVSHVGGNHVGGDLQSPTQETRNTNSLQQTADTDTIAVAQPKLYDNVPLEQMLTELSSYYNIKVEYRTEAVRKIRLFYQWKPEYTIEKVVEMLNNFETLRLQIENDTLIVSSTVEQQP